MLIKPKRLQPGDTIGVVALSSPIPKGRETRVDRGLAWLGSQGFGVKIGPHARGRSRHTAGTIAERLDDLHALVLDPEVKAVFCVRGGYNSHQLLEHIDYGLVQSHPKIFMGYSDVTTLLVTFLERAGLVTFQGPMVMLQMGEFGGMLPYTWESMKRVLMEGRAPMPLAPSEKWTDDRVPPGDAAPRALKPNPGPQVVRAGEVRGRLIGGNLGTLLLLAGTPYWPILKDRILFVEDDEVETPETYDRYFTRLRHMGVYREIAGLLVGRPHSASRFTDQDSLETIILEATHGYRFPIVTGLDFGHTDPMVTIPLGIEAEVNTFRPPYVTLLEAAVS